MSYDTPAENKAFAEKFNFNFPLLCDTSKRMGAAYGAGSSGNAKRIGVIIGPDGVIKDYTEKADTKKYPEEALTKI